MNNHTIKTSSLLKSDCPHERYLGRSVKNGLTRNLDWWRKMFLKGKVENNSVPTEYIMEEDVNLFINTISEIMTSLEFNYPGNWEVHLEYETGHYWSEELTQDIFGFISVNPIFLIRFPEITITNSENKFHTIKELFYMFTLSFAQTDHDVEDYYRVKSYYPASPLGVRGEITAIENYCNYFHSHLSGSEIKSHEMIYNPTEFCTGSNELNYLEAILREGFDANIFNLYLLTVGSYVRWESIEGRPYRYIKNIVEGKNTDIPLEWNQDFLSNFKDGIKNAMNNYHTLEANFNFMVDRFIIKIDEKFIRFVRACLIAYGNNNMLSNFLVQRKEGYYKGYGSMKIYTQKQLNERMQDEDGCQPFTYIRGEQIPFKIIAHKGKEVDPNDFTVHPSLLNYIKKQFENELYKKQVQRSAIESSITGNYAKKCIA
jgi:hypothetical protein